MAVLKVYASGKNRSGKIRSIDRERLTDKALDAMGYEALSPSSSMAMSPTKGRQVLARKGEGQNCPEETRKVEEEGPSSRLAQPS